MSELVFDDELYDMTSTVKPILADYFNASYVAEEFPFGTYRTDLAFVQVDFDIVHERLERFGHLKPILKRNRQKVYNWFSSNGPVTKEEFMENGPYAKSYKWSIVKWLLNQGYIESETKDGALPDDWPISAQTDTLYDAVEIPYHSTIYAVELKQENWEYAIVQANRAFRYADFWYVCMDDGGLPTEAQAKDELETNGAGLLTAIETEIREPKWSPSPAYRLNDESYDSWYDGDVSTFGTKERWRLNEESLEAICDAIQNGNTQSIIQDGTLEIESFEDGE